MRISTADANSASVCTPSRLLRSNSRAIAVIKNPPSTPASCEFDDADVSMLHWSDVHELSGFIGTSPRSWGHRLVGDRYRGTDYTKPNKLYNGTNKAAFHVCRRVS